MEEVFVRKIKLPPTITGMAVQDKAGDYNIYLNSQHTRETQVKTLQHEIQHISRNDFFRFDHVKDIEKE